MFLLLCAILSNVHGNKNLLLQSAEISVLKHSLLLKN